MKAFTSKHIVALIALLLVAAGILFYKIDQQYMWTDEVFSFHGAEMIIEKGKPLYDSGLYYIRAGVYHHLLAESIKFFGADEFGSRVVNVPFALGTMLISYFFVLDVFRDRKNRYVLALGAALLFLTANFTITAARETRMYTMATFFLTASVLTFYKAFLSEGRVTRLKLMGVTHNFNTVWVSLFTVSILLAYDTHAINALFGLGVLIFVLITAIMKRRRDLLIILTGLTFIALTGIYLRYGTVDLPAIFQSVIPPWGSETPNLLYYPLLLVRNFPGIFIVSPLILWSIYRYRKPLDIYLLTIFMTYLTFIATQTAQNERYLGPILPIMFILTVVGISRAAEIVKKGNLYKLVFVAVGVIAIPHMFLLAKELNEIDTYTPTSISIHKKFEFKSVFEYLEQRDLNKTTLIADEHSAYTLYQKGFVPDLILVPQNEAIISKEIIDGQITDIYFNIPFLSYKEGMLDYLTQNSDSEIIFVIRDFEEYPNIEKILDREEGFEQPRVYNF